MIVSSLLDKCACSELSLELLYIPNSPNVNINATSKKQRSLRNSYCNYTTPILHYPFILMPSPTRALKSPEQVQEDLLYLQEHKVCETLEFIVKGLLREQPEDPILSICNMLRASNRSNSSVRFNVGSSGGLSHSANREAQCTTIPVGDTSGSVVCSPVAHASSDRGLVTGADSVSNFGLRAAFSGSSRVGTPASSAPNGKWTDVQSNTTRLERDESSRSDGSAFSISSVDMSEFLSEFRAAHSGLFGESGRSHITLQDLADIVDRIAIPLPDVKLLVDLFAELKETPSSGEAHVLFDAFLARMNYKIQGRYPIEVVRNVFFSLVPQGDSSPQLHASRQGVPASASVGSNLDAFLLGTSSSEIEPKDSLADTQGLQRLMQSTPSAVVTIEKVSTALWHGLGLRHDLANLEGLLMPYTRGASVTLFMTDFIKLVQTMSSQSQR